MSWVKVTPAHNMPENTALTITKQAEGHHQRCPFIVKASGDPSVALILFMYVSVHRCPKLKVSQVHNKGVVW